MKKFLAFAFPFLCTASVFAADVAYTKPVGGFKSTAAANTDTRFSPTLARPSVWTGSIASAGANSLSAAGGPNWTANAFAPGSSTYYARILTGAVKGHYFIVTGNTADTLSVDSAGMNLSAIVAGDQCEISPFWTLGTLFPASQAGTAFVASASAFVRQTELFFYDASSVGTNRSASATYYFLNGAWRKFGANVATSFDSTIVFPDTYLIIRNKSNATSLLTVGSVQTGHIGSFLEAGVTANDNIVAISFPVDVTLDQSGLASSGAFTASPSAFVLKDQLFWYDPAATGTNRSADATYYYFNGAWRKFGSPVTSNFGNVVLKAGSGFIIRKAANGTSAPWTMNTGI